MHQTPKQPVNYQKEKYYMWSFFYCTQSLKWFRIINIYLKPTIFHLFNGSIIPSKNSSAQYWEVAVVLYKKYTKQFTVF